MQELRVAPDNLSARKTRFADDGYLLVRGLVDRARIEELATTVMAIVHDLGLDVADEHSVERFRATRSEFYATVQRLESFHALSHDPALLRFVRDLIGDDAFVHPQRLLRALLPEIPEFVTPPHQDLPYIGGTRAAVTTWLPLSRCHQGEGGLRLLLGSHQGDVVPHRKSGGVTAFEAIVADDDPAWATADYDPGDVLLFHSLAVHGATANTSGRMRLSFECRHQSAREPIAERSLKPMCYPDIPDWAELLQDRPWADRWLSVPADLTVVNRAE